MNNLLLESRVVSQDGQPVKIYWTNIPQFWGVFSDEIFQKAASLAIEKGWSEAIVTHVETPFSIFESGYCLLALKTEEMYRKPDSMYDENEFLCQMTRAGEIYVERPEQPEAEPHPWLYDGMEMMEDALSGE